MSVKVDPCLRGDDDVKNKKGRSTMPRPFPSVKPLSVLLGILDRHCVDDQTETDLIDGVTDVVDQIHV